jgi:small multidrug resistance pump
VIAIKTSERNGEVVGAIQVEDNDDVMLISNKGTLVRTPVNGISVVSRNTQGVSLIRVAEGEQLVGIERVMELGDSSSDSGGESSGDNGGESSGDNGGENSGDNGGGESNSENSAEGEKQLTSGFDKMSWWILIIAIVLEVSGTICMKLSEGFTKVGPSIAMLIFYLFGLALLAVALRKIDVSVAYAIWSGLGTALIAVVGMIWFKEPITTLKFLSLVLIILGVVGLNLQAGA